MADDRYILIRPPQLPELANVQAGAYVVGYNTATDQTVKINVSALGGGTETDINWRTSTVYQTGEIVEFGLKLWKSLIDNNQGNFPNEGANWTEVSKAGSGSNITNYTPGVYTFDPTIVLRQSKLYYLLAPKPFESVDFISELETNKWSEINRNNIVGVVYNNLIGSDYYMPNLDDTLIVLVPGQIGIEDGTQTVFYLTIEHPSYVIRIGTGYTEADFAVIPMGELLTGIPQSAVEGLVAKLIELEQSNPVRNVEFLRSTTISLFGETYYNTTVEEGSGSVLNITVPVTATTQGTANEIAQFASVPVLTGEAFTVRQVNINVLAYKNATSRVVSIYFELWNMDSSGVLTQLGTSNILTLTEQALSKDLFLSLDPNYVTSVGDRAILIGRAFQTGTGIAATATISIDDQTGSRWSFDVVAQETDGRIITDKDDNILVTRGVVKLMDGLNARDNPTTEQTEFYTENTDELPNIETAANASQPTINGNINARLFEQIAFVLSGYDIDVTTDSQDILKALPYAFKAYEIRAEFATAPTGSSAIVTFYKNGVSIGTVTVLAGEFVGTTVLTPVVSFAKGDSLSAVVTQIGMTIPGATAKAYIQGIKYQ